MKVAVFGCLHGMLNDMYEAVQLHETNTQTEIDLIIVCGDCQTIRHYDDLRCLSVPDKYKKVGDFHEYYSGRKTIPKLTIFVSGNHEASNYLMTMPYGGWVCDNFYYLGYSGVIKYRGLRIAGVSGIYNYRNSNRGRFECMPLNDESIRSIYHTRRLDVFRLQLLSRNIDKGSPVDVFISHDWPAKIYDHGDVEQLLRFKPLFRCDIYSRSGLGSPLTAPLLSQLKPKKWFAAHMHCKFYAKVHHKTTDDPGSDDGQEHSTEFLSLNKIEGQRRFVEYMDLHPSRKANYRANIYQDNVANDKLDELIESSERTDDSQQLDDDNNLYYDEEWLTILKKTVSLENNSGDNVVCPSIEDEDGQTYFPSEDEINETRNMMDQSGGLVIKRNFKMVEPVIYGRPDNANPSIDNNREKYFLNPQHEELCSRLGIVSSLHQHESSTPAASSSQNHGSHFHRRDQRNNRNQYNNRPYHQGNRSHNQHHQHHHQRGRGRGQHSGRRPYARRDHQDSAYNQPYKKVAFESDLEDNQQSPGDK